MVLFQNLCPAVVLSHQDGCHSAVALLLKAALIQVSDYRLLGASGSLNDRYAPKKLLDINHETLSRQILQLININKFNIDIRAI